MLSITVLQNQQELISKCYICYKLNPVPMGMQPYPHKNLFFQSNTYNIKVKIIFFHRNAKVTKLKHNLPCEKIVLMTSHIIWCHKIFSKYNCFMKARIDNCADIIKIAITLIKTTLKNLIAVKKITNHY